MKSQDNDTRGGMQHAMDRMQDFADGMIGLMTAMGTSDPEKFVSNAAIGDLYEVAAARTALERSQADDVRRIALKMIDDHQTATHQLRSTLRSIPDAPTPPNEPDERRRAMLEHLQTAPDEKFDQTYLEQQELAHQETLALFRGFADDGRDPRLTLFAQGAVPGLERHLDMVRQAREGGSGA